MGLFSFLWSHITLLEFLLSFFQIVENLVYILSILCTELLLVFNKSSLHQAIIIFNLIKCNNVLLNSILSIQWLLLIEKSIGFFNFGFINRDNHRFDLFYFFWRLIVTSFEFFICLIKIIKNLIYILFILSCKFFLIFNKLLT